MQAHEIQPTHKKRKSRRIGRGGKRGTYSGRGIKGQRARTGARFQPRIREWVKKYPKLRGSRAHIKRTKFAVINLEMLERYFEKGETVSARLLIEKKLVDTMKGRISKVKILGKGELTKPLFVQGCEVSSSAKKKIEKAGGNVTI